MNLSPLRSTLSKLASPLSRGTSGGYDTSIIPYAQRAIEKDVAKQKQFQPLRMVLDLLQRGQYLTANMADEIEESFRVGRPLGDATTQVLKAAFQGITGERKGDWETLLFGGNIEGEEGGKRAGWLPEDFKAMAEKPLIHWGGEEATGLAEGILRPRKWIGTAANIALDPTTYIGFGATKAAKTAASKYAQDTLKLTLATMGPDDFAKLGIEFSEKVGKNIDDVAKVMQKSTIAKRFMEDTYNKAFQTALKNPVTPQTLEEGLLKITSERLTENQGLEPLLQSIARGYPSAGERAFRLGGKEMGASVRQPWLPSQAWDTIKTKFEGTKGGAKLGDAWYSIMNTGPVGELKRAFGIRNPYEQLVHLTKRRTSDAGIHTMATNEAAKFNQLFKTVDDELKEKAKQVLIAAEGGNVDVVTRLTDPAFQAMLEIKPEEVDHLRGIFEKIKQTSDEWFDKEKMAAQAAGLPFDTEPRIVYFPQKVGVGNTAGGQLGREGAQGTGATGFTKAKKMSIGERIKNNAAVLDYLMGNKLKEAFENSKFTDYDQFLEDFVTKNNLTETALDLQEAFTIRGMDHAKAMVKYDMVEQFKQFGIPITDAIRAEPRLQSSLMTWGEGVSPTGLYKVNVQGFEDYLFDKTVADTLTNANVMLRGDASTQEFVKAFGWMTQWWKGFVLLTPGYHVRNWISNNVTGFLKFGPRWLDPQKTFGPVAVGTKYAMHPENYMDLITKELKVSEGWVLKQLNSRIGDFKVSELADYFRQSGLISARTQIAGEIGQRVGGKGILEKVSAKQFRPFKVSQKLGDFIENTSKFQSAIMDYEDVFKGAANQSADIAERLAANKQYLEYADQEAKKWFIDYTDLSDFEKKYLAKVIPFYSWLRHNIANQLSGLALYPEMYSVIPKVRGALTSDEDFDYSIMPDYMKNQGYYPVGKTQKGTDVMRWANIPLEDVNKIPVMFEEGNIFRPRMNWRETVDDIMAASHPLLKSAIEMATGYDVFHKREIQPFEKGAPIFQYLSNAPNVIKFLDGAMRLAGFEDGIKINVSRDGKEVQINGKVERFLESNAPALRTLDLLVGGAEVVAEGFDQKVEKWVETTFGKKDYYKGLEELFQITSPYAGVKFKEFNEDEQRKTKEAQLYAEAQRLKGREAQDTIAKEIRSAKARKARETRNRRLFR